MFRRHAVQSRKDQVLCAPGRLTMHSQREGDVHVIELVGELDMDSAPAFDGELKRVEHSDVREIVVDLSGLNSISSDGLKALIHAESRARVHHNRLRLLRGNDRVHNTFETVGLVTRLPFDDDRRLHREPRRARLAVSTPVTDWNP